MKADQNFLAYWTLLSGAPLRTVWIVTAIILVFGAGLTNVIKDPSVDAFVPDTHPAAIAREDAKELFGLEDPIIIGLAAETGASAFTPTTLKALKAIQAEVRQLPNVDKNGLISVATENVIRGNGGDLEVESILERGTVTDETAAAAWANLQEMPMMAGLLASETGDTVTLIVPVKDPNAADTTYHSIKAISESLAPDDVTAHVAGVAAMNGRLGQMVSDDTRLFVPLAVVMAALTVMFALRRPKALIGPLFVIAGSAAMAIGLMGWLDARYYLITTALPVIIMAIAIADSLHISTIYLRIRSDDPSATAKQALFDALRRTFLPITLTTITTIAGFIGLALGSPMQPISEFGLFAAAGVGAAWFLSLTALPAIILYTDLAPRANDHTKGNYVLDRALTRVTSLAYDNPFRVAGGLVFVIGLFAFYASQAEFDYERKRYFVESDAVRAADIALNDRLMGLNFLDVIVSADDASGLMAPKALADMDTLQSQLSEMDEIEKAVSIVDYMSLMHGVLTDAPDAGLPTAERAPAQYMFLYESSGDPGDFDEEIDYDHQHALIRTHLKTDQFTATVDLVDRFNAMASAWSETSGLEARVSGRVAVNDGWMSLLSTSHFMGLGLAVTLVFLAAILVLRSLIDAVLTLIPVLTGVLLTYACMGFFNIDIAPATSMTAAIATGLGVDFGIHLITAARGSAMTAPDLRTALQGKYITVARACFYSAIALALALSVVTASSAPPLRWFGALVSAGAIGSLIGALLVLPCILAILHRSNLWTVGRKEATA